MRFVTRKAIFLVLGLLISTGAGSCKRSQTNDAGTASGKENSIEIIDVLNRKVVVNNPVNRIYYGFYYENLLAVGGPDVFKKVTATSLYDTEGYFLTLSKLYRTHIAGYANMIDIGSTLQDDFDTEKLLELELDAIIIGAYQYADLGSRVAVLENAGVPVVVINYSLGTLEMQCKSTEILGKIFGQEERADEIITQYQNAYADIAKRVSDIKQKKLVFSEFHSEITSYKEIGTSGGGIPFIARYIENAGGINLIDKSLEQSSQARIAPEYLLEADPDAIVIIGGESTNTAKEGVLMGHNIAEPAVIASAKNMYPSRPGWENMNAVTHDAVFFIENGICRTMADYTIVQFIGKSLYPERFAGVDPLENLRAYYARYLPSLPFNGVFFYHYQR